MATETEYLAALERRISTLERRLIGDEKVREGQPSLIRLINTINGKLVALADSTPVVEEVWCLKEKLEKFLQQNRSIKLDEKAKEEIILSYTDHLAKLHDQLEEINALKDSINSPSFRGLEKENQEIATLARVHIDQEKDLEVLTNQVQTFIGNYTRLLLQLSQQCVEWDELLTSLES